MAKQQVLLSDLKKSGYARTSRKYGMVSRLDRPDWKEHMASTHVSGMNWVNCLGDRNAADFYRRCISKDTLEISPHLALKLPCSDAGPTVYLEKVYA